MKIKTKPQPVQESDSPFPFADRPAFSDSLKFPDNVTELDVAGVSELLGKYGQLWCFANQGLSQVNVRILSAQLDESKLINSIFRENGSVNSIEKWRRDAVFDSDPQLEAIREKIQRLKMEKETLLMFVGNFDRHCQTLSRELSRRLHQPSVPLRDRY